MVRMDMNLKIWIYTTTKPAYVFLPYSLSFFLDNVLLTSRERHVGLLDQIAIYLFIYVDA
jgi:hypothetical protein